MGPRFSAARNFAHDAADVAVATIGGAVAVTLFFPLYLAASAVKGALGPLRRGRRGSAGGVLPRKDAERATVLK